MSRTFHPTAKLAAALGCALVAGMSFASLASAEEEVSFKLDVLPILASRCAECHQTGGSGLEASGLNLTSYDGLMKGTKHGPIIVPGEPTVSNLNVLIEGRADPSMRMPHDQRPLLKEQQRIIRNWVKQGAKNN
ncbi:MAG: hypothetical protein H6905_06610 [Hyphomicrobiales bacterium]|nr:hypothetical protein [Hyphomicrobiales bacterium]